MSSNDPLSVIPAQLSFLTIFNPSLGKTDRTLHEQIVFYTSKSNSARPSRSADRYGDPFSRESSEDENEKLRQVGLAQGMVSFAKNFSYEENVDSIETERSRIVLHELEPGWWILANLDLTRLPNRQRASSAAQPNTHGEPRGEYSSRELSPPFLLRRQLVKAHTVFLIHHAPSLDDLYDRLSREKFCNILDRFWAKFIRNWDVLLHGHPAVDLFSGMKLAGGGELGIGVGEEEWGSGEREVLEGFISRTEGLVDMVVSKFGDNAPSCNDVGGLERSASADGHRLLNKFRWTGHGLYPGPDDGVIFSGTRAISRTSLTRVSQWVEWIYRYGEDAYGVRDDPKSTRRKRQQKGRSKNPSQSQKPKSLSTSKPSSAKSTSNRSPSPRIPPPLVISSDAQQSPNAKDSEREKSVENLADTSVFGADTFMKLVTLGYGSAWGNTPKGPPSHPRVDVLRGGSNHTRDNESSSESKGISSESNSLERSNPMHQLDESPGQFIIGFRDDLENEDSSDEDIHCDGIDRKDRNKRSRSKILVRTLKLSMRGDDSGLESNDSGSTHMFKTLQVVVYLYQPFIFTFLFEPGTPSLSSSTFYRSIHHQLGPLQKTLLSSTSPTKIHQRISHYGPYRGASSGNKSSQNEALYDIIYDPSHQTIRTSLPNVPEPRIPTDSIRATRLGPSVLPPSPPWSRIDALNVYMQIINTYTEARSNPLETERTCKTNRGWWVLWMRLNPPSPQHSQHHEDSHTVKDSTCTITETATASEAKESSKAVLEQPKQAFLVRQASDYKPQGPGHPRKTKGRGLFGSISGNSSGSGWETGNLSMAPGKLVEGVGLDARKYIDALINSSR